MCVLYVCLVAQLSSTNYINVVVACHSYYKCCRRLYYECLLLLRQLVAVEWPRCHTCSRHMCTHEASIYWSIYPWQPLSGAHCCHTSFNSRQSPLRPYTCLSPPCGPEVANGCELMSWRSFSCGWLICSPISYENIKWRSVECGLVYVCKFCWLFFSPPD